MEKDWRNAIVHATWDSSPDAIVVANADGNIVEVNPGFCRLFGYDLHEFLGESVLLLYASPEEFARDQSFRETPTTSVNAAPHEISFRHKTGEVFVAESLHIEARVNDDDVSIASILQIRALRSNRTVVREPANQFLDSIVENIPYMIFVKDANELRFVRFNRAGEKLLGYNRDELIGKNDYDFFPQEEADFFVTRDREVLKNKVLIDVPEEPIHTHDGQKFLHTKKIPILDENGSPKFLLGISEDITHRKLAEQNLNRFRNALDKTLDMIVLIDATSLKFLHVNRGASRISGYARAKLLSMSVLDLLPLLNVDHFVKIKNEISVREKSPQVLETDLRLFSGQMLPVEVRLEFIAEEAPPGLFVVLMRDITERRKIEKFKDDFISTVSHELRTPLTSIRGAIGLVRAGVTGDLPEQTKGLIAMAEKNCQRLEYLINDILDVEKIAFGKIALDLEPQFVDELVKAALEENKGLAEKFAVHFRLKGKLPHVRIFVDTQRFMQILANLLSNAAKFSHAGKTVEVFAEQFCHSSRVKISVLDHGIGIPETFREKIFHRFSQADSSSTRAAQGTGLGLNICRSLVEEMNGELGYDSHVGKGSTFYFSFPIFVDTVNVAKDRDQ